MKEINQKNIFIIDDNKIFALLLKTEIERSFAQENFCVTIFESGEACMDKLHLKPDLAIVDYHLATKVGHVLNGLEVIDMIREHSGETEFIMITFDEQTELFIRSQAFDIYDYLTKSTNVTYKLNLSILQWLKLKNNKIA